MNIRYGIITGALVAGLALTACQPKDVITIEEQIANDAIVDQELGLHTGKKPLSLAQANEIFSEVCIKGVAPSAFSLKQNPTTKTWSSDTLALSLLLDGFGLDCSFIFASTEDRVDVFAQLLASSEPYVLQDGSEPQLGAGENFVSVGLKGDTYASAISARGSQNGVQIYGAIVGENSKMERLELEGSGE